MSQTLNAAITVIGIVPQADVSRSERNPRAEDRRLSESRLADATERLPLVVRNSHQ